MEEQKVEEYKIEFEIKVKRKESSYSWDTMAKQNVELTVPEGDDPKEFLRQELTKGCKQVTERKLPYGEWAEPSNDVGL